jgi:hypothetical protein
MRPPGTRTWESGKAAIAPTSTDRATAGIVIMKLLAMLRPIRFQPSM